jgi:hypothetical protein
MQYAVTQFAGSKEIQLSPPHGIGHRVGDSVHTGIKGDDGILPHLGEPSGNQGGQPGPNESSVFGFIEKPELLCAG